MFNDETILITGGTGSFGQKFIEHVLENYNPRKLIIYSRDELKQFNMEKSLKERFRDAGALRFFIGDVRDKERLMRALHNVNYIVHAAALKQIPAAERDPFECIKTNIMGAQNVINAAIDSGVKKVIALSTDKAANPVNLYGASKLCSDKLFVSGNNYSGDDGPAFSVVRYGNVVGSRGSVVPYFLEAKKKGVIPITDERMTRFWITLEHGVKFVIDSLSRMKGGEIFVPKIPSCNILTLAEAIAPGCKIEYVGIRPGEKLHEVMITSDDSRNTSEFDNFYSIFPQFIELASLNGGCITYNCQQGKQVEEGFEYNSKDNKNILTVDQLRNIINSI
jgi:UDP-N-acetylglucosamine 4,6-dehydratase|tara:strand:- start:395 stop:1399 length:1005 start_codon:yes stop_codon:yes gene_type:complete